MMGQDAGGRESVSSSLKCKDWPANASRSSVSSVVGPLLDIRAFLMSRICCKVMFMTTDDFKKAMLDGTESKPCEGQGQHDIKK